MSEAITTARPYAQAAFDEAKKLKDLQGWSEMLRSLADAVNHPEVHAVVTNPRIPRQQIEAMMEALLASGCAAQQRNFVRILADNQRLLLLPEISALFEAFKAEAEKSVNVVVDSAFELNAAQQDKIASSLKKRLAREIKLTCNVKKDLLGGVVIRAGDKVIDGSALTRLAEMANALA
ncbi:MAG: F0F1 ATP synthase subunit delta [Sideroxydans sp.]